jgi:hypothetical protein
MKSTIETYIATLYNTYRQTLGEILKFKGKCMAVSNTKDI